MTASQVADAVGRQAQNAMRGLFVIATLGRFRLRTLAARDVDRGAQVGERVSGAELPPRLIEVKPHDRHAAARR